MRLKALMVAVLAGLVMVPGIGTAIAAEDVGADDAPVLEDVQAAAIERIEGRIAYLESVIADLEGEDGALAARRVALATEGIEIYEAALAEVEAAGTVAEIAAAVRSANKEFRNLKRVRLLYAHVQRDIDKFGNRLDALERAIERAEGAGADVAGAVAEAVEASSALEDAQAALDAIDPSMTGREVVQAIKEAHRTAHAGQKHIRLGFEALLEALPPPE